MTSPPESYEEKSQSIKATYELSEADLQQEIKTLLALQADDLPEVAENLHAMDVQKIIELAPTKQVDSSCFMTDLKIPGCFGGKGANLIDVLARARTGTRTAAAQNRIEQDCENYILEYLEIYKELTALRKDLTELLLLQASTVS